MRRISLTVNGRPVEGAVEPRTSLADFLRDGLDLTGTRLGCEHGVCGTCTVLMDGAPVRSCILLAVACDGKSIRTVEGFDDDPTMSRLREAFSREHALQCGFCTAGMLISARDIVDRLDSPDEARIRKELNGNLCRCTGYLGIVRAIQSVIEEPPPPQQGEVAGKGEAEAGPPPKSIPGKAEAPVLEGKRGWTRIEQRFRVERPRAEVWSMLGDPSAAAACLPGAEVTGIDGEKIEGRINLRLGPITASFAGSGVLTRDDAAWSGTLRGGGRDSLSATRVDAEIEYRLEAAAGGGGTEVSVTLEFRLTGPLAQFGRSGLVNDFANRLTAEFAANLSARMTGEAAAKPGPPRLNLGSLLWSAIVARLRRFLGG